MKRRLFAFLASVLAALPLSAEYNKLGIPDSAEIRANLVRSWFTASLEQVREHGIELHTSDIGTHFQVRMEENDKTFAVIVAPAVELPVNVFTERGAERRFVEQYPGDASGAWVLTRDSESGKPLHLRVYFGQNNNVYIQFTPNRNIAYADFVLYGCYAARGVPLGLGFNQLYTASFAKILSLTEKTLPWQYAEIQTGQYDDTMQMIGVIRNNLSRITYAPDAAYNEDGEPIRISDGKARAVNYVQREGGQLSLSSAGFVKWVIDGLVEPLTGSATYRAPLLQQTVEFNPLSYTGILHNGRQSADGVQVKDGEDISFTLNWARNLAAARLSAQTKRNYLYSESGMDVTIEPFNGEVGADGVTVEQAVGYIADTGYQIERLRPLLYVLAVSEPTYCYIAAVRRRSDGASTKTAQEPEVYKFDQIAVLFPYFDKTERFNCIVFENGKELSLSQFAAKYRGSFVHLSRVLTSRDFYPQ